ncbi:MAG: PKD domain-containing protein [Bacteroidota bacterium]
MNKQYSFLIASLKIPKHLVLLGALLSCFAASAIVPVVDFTANKTSTFEEDTILFTDASTQTPTSWTWNFPGGTPAASTLQNPQISYARPGVYSVTHGATNSTGAGTPITKTNYITITEKSKGYNNASAYTLVNPVFQCPGQHEIKVLIKNRGKNIINGLFIDWELNGVPQSQIYWNYPIDTLNSTDGNDTLLTLGNVNLLAGASQNLKVWTSNPNFVADTITKDDTLTVRLGASLGGSYTIGGTSPDFITMGAAIAAMDSFGLCGPVTFNLRNGTYAGQVVINEIKGASATNTVTFQSENLDASLVTLTYVPAGANDNYTIRLNNSKYVSLKDLSIRSTGTTYAKAIELLGNVSFDTITRCSVSSITTTSTAPASYAGIYASAVTGSNMVIRNNVITGGASGLYFVGTSTTALFGTGLIVDSNTFSGAAYYPVYMYYINAPAFKNNKVIVSGTTATTVYPATFGYCDNTLEITGNQFTVTGSTATIYGVRVYYCDATVSQHATFSNNTLSFQTSGALYGALYSYYSSNVDFFNNSINNYSNGATNYAAYLYHTSASTGCAFKNNIIANNSTTGFALYVYDPLYITSDFNLLYSTSGNMVYKGIATTTSYPTLNSYRTDFPAQEKRSLVYRPAFTSNTNLTPLTTDTACWAMNGRGTHTGLIADINGNGRPVSLTDGVPDLGAYQFTPDAAVPVATATPATPAAGQTQAFVFAGDTLAQITWDAFAPVPAFVDLKFYPDSLSQLTSDFQLRSHWLINMDPGSYNYALKLRYKTNMLHNIPSQQNMILSKKLGGFWSHYYNPNTITDSANSTMTISGLSDYQLMLTGTDNTFPLPVKLAGIRAIRKGNSISVNWTTAMEKNVSHFEVERAFDSRGFEAVGKVKATGNSSITRDYSFADAGIFNIPSNIIYYRVRSVDVDGAYQYSSIVSVTNDDATIKDGQSLSAYPNPFSDKLTIDVTVTADATANIELLRNDGTVAEHFVSAMKAGTNNISLDKLSSLGKGLYIIRVTAPTENFILKAIKE